MLIPTQMPKKSAKFNSFIRQANVFYKSIGLEAYNKDNGKRRSYFLDLIFIINIINLNFVLISEVIYVGLAMKNNNNFVEATMNLSYIGFVFVGDVKIWSMRFKKEALSKFMHDLKQMYPKRERQMEAYRTGRFLFNYTRINVFFITTHLILIWTYNLFPIVSYLVYNRWLQTYDFPLTLPYYCWVPWDWHGHWSYAFLYASQNLAGHTCMMGQLANDMLLCAVVTQIIMHYQFLAKHIDTHVTGLVKKAKSADESDEKFLLKVIEYHQKILNLSYDMNGIFGVSLLLNFLSSSFIICFLGFQLTIGVDTTILIMLLLFLFCSLVQIYMLCNYGHDLMLASESIGHAVYQHKWFNGNMRYKKLLVMIIERAQRPALLKATTFLNVSLGTMTDLLQLSYKFFALIRTMYSK